MKKINKEYLFLLGLLLTILPYFYLCFFANPSADDFSFSAQAKANNFFHFLYANYLYWNGRYISNIFIYINPLTFGSFIGYKIVSFLLIIAFIFANFFFVKELFYIKSIKERLIITLILSLIFLHNMPIISEGIYWYTGSVIYFLGTISTLFYIAFFIRILRKNKKGASYLFLTLLLLFACGFNEVLTLLIVFFLAMASFISYKKSLRGRNVIIIQLLISLLFASIMIFSPGNSVRGEAYLEAHNFSHSLIYSLLQVGRFTSLWLLSIPFIITSLLYYPLNKKMCVENNLFKNSFYFNRWGSLLMLFAITFICVCPAYWATGMLGQHRTLNVAYYFFIIMWFLNLTVWFNHYQIKTNFILTPKIKTGLIVFMITGFLFSGNGYNALSDIYLDTAKKYNFELTQRFKMLKKATNKQQEAILISPLIAKPKTLFTSDVSRDSNNWTNKAYLEYFNVARIEVVFN